MTLPECEVSTEYREVDGQISGWLSDVNLVSFSGGKDSTTVLQLVLGAIRDTGQKLYIVTADTLMEIPYFQQYVDAVRSRIQNYINRSGINAELITVRPKTEHSFWVSVLGRGYPAASMGFRWCTGRLKIDPITKFTRQVTKGKDFSVFVGVRSAESPIRARIYKDKNYKPNHYAPILNWTSHEVWEYLLTEPCPWGDDHSEIVKVYRYSSDECVYGEAQGVCVGNARYGCWACPLQSENQLDMIAYNTGEDRYRKLKRYKKLLVKCAANPNYRSRIRRNGDEGVGPFLVENRKLLFRDLKKVEEITGWRLITPEEETEIRRHWQIDEHIHNIN
jgi:DNA sulfur modification protein DndC